MTTTKQSSLSLTKLLATAALGAGGVAAARTLKTNNAPVDAYVGGNPPSVQVTSAPRGPVSAPPAPRGPVGAPPPAPQGPVSAPPAPNGPKGGPSGAPPAPNGPKGGPSGAPPAPIGPKGGPAVAPPPPPQPSGAGTISLTNYPGLCMDVLVTAGTQIPVPGETVDLMNCDGLATQHWSVNANHTITVNGYCLDIVGGQASAGAFLEVADCDGASSQQWVNTNKLIESGNSNLCVDVLNGTPYAYMSVVLQPCGNAPTQAWITP